MIAICHFKILSKSICMPIIIRLLAAESIFLMKYSGYGYTRARQTLWVCIAVHFLLGALTSSVMSFTPAPEVNELAYKAVLDTQWEMIIGNAVGMIAGFTVNGFILAKLKIKFAGKNLWLRTISSTFLAELVYSGVCSFIAFHNDLSILQLVKLQIL
jgi:uncharacterized PurR-regulated membrane protein YhhQ (DUF165 family)